MATLNNMDNERLHMSPVHKRLQMSVVRVEPGLAILSMPLSEDVRGYFDGSIHGGMLRDLRRCGVCFLPR